MESLKFIFPSRMSDAKVFVPTGEFGLGNLKSVKKASKKSPEERTLRILLSNKLLSVLVWMSV